MESILKERRQQLGMTMLQVAQAVGVSEATVSRWESGDIANMRRDKIAKLASALQLRPSVVMGITDEPSEKRSAVKNTNSFDLTAHEKQLVISYRSHPEMQPAVDAILGIQSEVKKENLA